MEANWETGELAQLASGLRMSQDLIHSMILVKKRKHPSIEEKGMPIDLFNTDMAVTDDWRPSLKRYLESLSAKVPHCIKVQALNYLLLEGELF